MGAFGALEFGETYINHSYRAHIGRTTRVTLSINGVETSNWSIVICCGANERPYICTSFLRLAVSCYDGLAPTISVVRLRRRLRVRHHRTYVQTLLAIRGIAYDICPATLNVV